MAYTKTEWVNDSVPAINASNLNKIEQGIYDHAFESGSNANGYYIKFYDGTLICWKKVSGETTCNSAWGSMYETPRISLGDYPVAFISSPYISITPTSGSDIFFEGIRRTSTTNFGEARLARSTSLDSLDYNINCIAMGRWK